MAVHPQRTTWTDERLDDLSQSVRDGFARNDEEHLAMRREMREGFERLSAEMREGFARVDDRFDRVDDRFDRVDDRFARNDERFDALQRALIIAMAGLVTAVFVSNLLG